MCFTLPNTDSYPTDTDTKVLQLTTEPLIRSDSANTPTRWTNGPCRVSVWGSVKTVIPLPLLTAHGFQSSVHGVLHHVDGPKPVVLRQFWSQFLTVPVEQRHHLLQVLDTKKRIYLTPSSFPNITWKQWDLDRNCI